MATLTLAQRQFLESHRVARFGTIDPAGQPHLIPICFATDGVVIYTPLDEKPKRVEPGQLQRVRNLEAHPEVAFLVDDYSDDWGKLAWLMIRGRADLIEPDQDGHAEAVRLLRDKYPQYRTMAIDRRPIIRIRPDRARAWAWTTTDLST